MPVARLEADLGLAADFAEQPVMPVKTLDQGSGNRDGFRVLDMRHRRTRW